MSRPAALQRREHGRFDKEFFLFAAVHPGIVAALLVRVFGIGLILRLAGAGAGGLDPALAQNERSPIIGLAGVLAKEFALQISQKGIHRIHVFQNPPVSLAVLRQIHGASASGSCRGLIFGVKIRNEILRLVRP